MHSRTVIAIPPSYDEEENLETNSTKKYLKHLQSEGASCVMSTAGTSHFNVLDIGEIHSFNKTLVDEFDGDKIIGIPALSQKRAKDFIQEAENYLDTNSRLMGLYPERFYDENTLIEYFSSLREETKLPIYIHAKTIRNGNGGNWNYNSSVINFLFQKNIICGIKEEHPNLNSSYDFVSGIEKGMDIIVAGGSMRRYEFLRSAGATSFLSGVGNIYPRIEQSYLDGKIDYALDKEKKMFKVFMKYGWHKSLRIALKNLDWTCYYNRQPWANVSLAEEKEIIEVIKEINDER